MKSHKRFLLALNFAGLALIAWMVAGAINDYLAAELFAVPQPPAVKAETDPSQLGLGAGRVSDEQYAASVLGDRRIFELDPKTYEDPKPDEPEEPDEPEDADDEGPLEDSELPIDLMGTMVSPQGPDMASLRVEGDNKLAYAGTTLLDGKAKVVAIAERAVILDESGTQTILHLWTEDKNAAPKRARARPPKRPRSTRTTNPARSARATKAAQRRSQRARYRSMVKKTGAYSYQIDGDDLRSELKDLSKLGKQARVVPNYKGGRYEGFKLVGVRPGSLYRNLGIRSGDVIKAVNGRAINSPNKALELYEQLKSSSQVEVEIMRRGRPQTLSYSID